jgi:hypothetical protein
MSAKQDALLEIVGIAKRNGIGADEIVAALAGPEPQGGKEASSILSRLFGYIGGILVFSGICVFISMYWDDFGPVARITVTWGVGLAAFLMALGCLLDERYERAATPLFLASALLQPGGIFVMLDEFAAGGDPHYGVLFMASYMVVQQGFTFWVKRQTVLAFGTVLFGVIFFAALFDLWDFDEDLSGAVIGTSLLCVAYALDCSRHAAIAPFWYLLGSVSLLWAVFDAVDDTPFEPLYLGLAALTIFLSTVVRSRTLLGVGTLAMLVYIGYFTAQHFADSIGWPVALVIMGVALIGLSSLAVKLNSKYIKQRG